MTAARALRIALVTTFYPPFNFGGDGIYVRRLAHALARQGCKVTVLHDRDAFRVLAPADRRHPEQLPEPDGVEVIGLESPLGPLSPFLTQQLGAPIVNASKIRDVLGRGFDIIHYHNVSLVGGPGILSMGPPAIRLYTAHEHWLVCPTHILWRNNRELCTHRACTSCQIAHRRPPQAWRATGVLERHAAAIDAFIALSESSAENHRRFGFPFPMRVMPSFLPDRPPAEATPHPNGGRPYVFFAGRLETIKGLQDVIPQFLGAPEADLLIAGDGDFGPALKALAGDAEHVRFLGRIEPDRMDALYEHALALIAPSRCYEVFPLVALEAFREGCPIIARNLGSYPEIVSQSQAGLLFNHPDELPGLLGRLVSEPGLRARMSSAARAAFVAKWSESASLSEYWKLVQSIAETKHMTATAALAAGMFCSLRQ